jgi:hypothetical protein
MEETIKKQTESGFTYTAFKFPAILSESDIGKSVIISSHNGKVFVLYKIHPEGSKGFKDGGVECVVSNSGISKHYFLLDQVRFYDGVNLIKSKK